MTLSMPLTPDHRRTYERDGYVVIRQLVPREEALAMGEHYDQVIARKLAEQAQAGLQRKGQLVQLPGPVSAGEAWENRPYFQRVLEIGRALGGEDITFAYDQIIMKPPRYAATTPWHQDAGYWRGLPLAAERALTCWLALSQVTRAHGCMTFIPGSHRGPVVEHHSVADRSEVNAALEAKVDESQAVAVPLEPGDATFHHARTLHYTAGNEADTPRRGLITHLWPKEARDQQGA